MGTKGFQIRGSYLGPMVWIEEPQCWGLFPPERFYKEKAAGSSESPFTQRLENFSAAATTPGLSYCKACDELFLILIINPYSRV